MSISDKAKFWAILAHQDANHKYDGKPYSFHLQHVVDIANKFINYLPVGLRTDQIIAACWAHDTIEDARKTYNDVKNELGEDVADIVYALTNEKGKTRKERANGKYYMGISSVRQATFVKLCDRIANLEYSISAGSSMASKYAQEHSDFELYLNDGYRYANMWNYLRQLCQQALTQTTNNDTTTGKD